MSDLIPLTVYAERIGKKHNTVLKKCIRGALPGAVKIGRDWLIPADTPYQDQRVTTGKYKNWRKPQTDENRGGTENEV